MNIVSLQDSLRNTIAANTFLAGNAAATVFVDVGGSKHQQEAAFEEFGYSISVWPPASGQGNQDDDQSDGALSTLIVRLEINPLFLIKAQAAYEANNALPTAAQYLATLMRSIVAGALSSVGRDQLRFALSHLHAFELISFGEGLIAYHFRFVRFVVFGT